MPYIYKQIDGCAMGNPAYSAIVANLQIQILHTTLPSGVFSECMVTL